VEFPTERVNMSRAMNGVRAESPCRAAALLAVSAAAAVICALAASSASAAVGIEKVSRHGGEPGDEVTLTLSCGFCFPPCKGPKGDRHPEGFDHGPCMLDTKSAPPSSFGISLVPRSKAPEPRKCGHRAVCSLGAPAPPRQYPYAFLGLAVPPPGGNNPEHGDPPRYLLHFTIPSLRTGAYAYVVWCDACMEGARGSLIAVPASRLWRLVVRRHSGARSGRAGATEVAPRTATEQFGLPLW
jgi:hypothetical protein